MHRFRFKSVLRHRENIEKNRMHEISKLQASLAEEERVLSFTVLQIKDILEHIGKEANEGIRSNEVSMYRTFVESARASMRVQEEKILAVQELIEKKRRQLIHASKEKKVIENLKRKKMESAALELKKKEQKIMDDIVQNYLAI